MKQYQPIENRKTMKKYSKPTIVTRTIASTPLMAASLGIDSNEGEGGNDAVRGRRGTWGNLWYDGYLEEEH